MKVQNRRCAGIALKAGLVLLPLATLVAFGGRWYAISKVPADQLRRMGDTDWVGVGWIAAGGVLLLLAVLALLTGAALWLMQPKREPKRE